MYQVLVNKVEYLLEIFVENLDWFVFFEHFVYSVVRLARGGVGFFITAQTCFGGP